MTKMQQQLQRIQAFIANHGNVSDNLAMADLLHYVAELEERMPAISALAWRKVRKLETMGGAVCGVLVVGKAGNAAIITDLGRVTWVDRGVLGPVEGKEQTDA